MGLSLRAAWETDEALNPPPPVPHGEGRHRGSGRPSSRGQTGAAAGPASRPPSPLLVAVPGDGGECPRHPRKGPQLRRPRCPPLGKRDVDNVYVAHCL